MPDVIAKPPSGHCMASLRVVESVGVMIPDGTLKPPTGHVVELDCSSVVDDFCGVRVCKMVGVALLFIGGVGAIQGEGGTRVIGVGGVLV